MPGPTRGRRRAADARRRLRLTLGRVASDVAAAVAAVWRHESADVLATLVRMTRDVELAEDLAQEAMLAALQQWPVEGIPAKPGAWLVAVAKRRAVDHFRRAETRRRLGERSARPAGRTRCPTRERSNGSRTTYCGWSTSPATRCSRRTPGPR